MTRYGSDKVAFFTVAGLNVVGTLTDFEDRREAKTEESHGLGVGWAEHTYLGVREAEITQNGFYDDDVGSIHDVLSSGPGSTNILAYSLEGTATGAEFVAYGPGVQVNYNRQVARDALTKAQAVYRLGEGGRAEQGVVLHTYKALTATGKFGIVDLGVSSTGAAGYLAYNASAGECNVRIMHSDSAGNTSYSALFTFARTASGHGAERMSTTGVVKRYVCADFTTASATGAIAALNAFVGFVQKPQ